MTARVVVATVVMAASPLVSIVATSPGLAVPSDGSAVFQTSRIDEDSSTWDCRADGNRVCGPGNVQQVIPGCYDDAGALVSGWPCRVVVNPDGSSDVYEGGQ